MQISIPAAYLIGGKKKKENNVATLIDDFAIIATKENSGDEIACSCNSGGNGIRPAAEGMYLFVSRRQWLKHG